MPTITVIETFDGRGATLNERGDREHTRTFYVETNEALLDHIDVGNSLPVRRGDPYQGPLGQFDGGATVRNIEVRQRSESPYLWTATVKYSSAPLSEGGSGSPGGGDTPDQAGQENPLLRPAEIRWGSTRVSKVVDRSIFEKPILNSAGQPFDPPPQREEVHMTLTISQNIAPAAWNPLHITRYVNHVNSEYWGGYAPNKVKCTALEAERHFENGVFFYRRNMTFEFDMSEFGWKLRVLDAGYYELVSDELKPITDPHTGRPVSRPSLLRDGLALSPVSGDFDDPQYLTFSIFELADFNDLIQLPANF